MDDQVTETSADAISDEAGTVRKPVPAHLASSGPSDDAATDRPRRRWPYVVVGVPLVLLVLATVAWAFDTAGGGVARNVTLAGEAVGGLSEAELTTRVATAAQAFAETPVEISVGDDTYVTTAGGIGLFVDEDRTAANVLDVGSDTFVLLRPFDWMRSFVVEREVDFTLQVNIDRLTSHAIELEGADRTPPTEPEVELVDGSFQVVPGVDGEGIEPKSLADSLSRAAAGMKPGQAIRVEAERGPIAPIGTDQDARDAAARAEDLVDQDIEIQTEAGSRTVTSAHLRSWVVLTSEPDTGVVVDLDPAKVDDTLRSLFADLEGAPVDASFTLQNGAPVIIPDKPGLVCCGATAPESILTALRAGETAVTLDLLEGQARFTAAEAEKWGIVGPVGGNHAWRDGAPTTAAPGFTTYHAAGGNRVINIHRIADLVRGVVIPPGGTFSINDHVGRRTPEKGFVPAGAISNGIHVDEVGGGISQFATTMFNAAYFAGLDIVEYQAHSEYFSRYPRGREATMGFPAPDLKVKNSTPYGILVWTSYTDTSLTVTMYSSPYATAEQTGIREAPEGNCTVVVTTRTRTFPDGRTEDDTFRARYRPGEGQGC